MMEWVVSGERLAAVAQQAYDAGRNGDEVFTHMGADGPAVVRCRDCAFDKQECILGEERGMHPDGFCAWGIDEDWQ